MLAPSPPPRMIIWTLRAWPDRNTAAWPAELPPPTSTTSWPTHSLASIGEASGTAAEDGHVVEFFMRLVGDHPRRQRQRRLGRIAQHGAVGAHHQRQIGARGRIARDEVGGVPASCGIEHVVRLAVAHQEI